MHLSPYAVQTIDWTNREADINISRDQVKGSPPWNPEAIIDRVYQKRLHGYYGWPRYGW